MTEAPASSEDLPRQETPSHRPRHKEGMAGWMARAFIDSKLTPLLVVASIAAGVYATLQIAREEEPQIKVPTIDILVTMPGGASSEIEERVSRPH